ncbi:MAG: tetratricopeptide repeat protein [Nostoc sp. ChiSLP01]|nr:tetratricopeptide repeat protein [Nostoc sp. CmiSLP01]MDZ8283503.1 tetratricopeptide repeat protein [Nostoc sp. ChiSLP01]
MTKCKLLASLLTLILSSLTQVVIAQSVEQQFQTSEVKENHLQMEVRCQESPYCLNQKGYQLYKEFKLEEAIKLYRKAIHLHLQLNPTDPHHESIAIIYNNLGQALEKQEKTSEARQAYNEAIKHNSKYANAYNNLGHILYLLQELEPATANLRKAIELEPNNSTYHSNLAKALRAQGKPQEAKIVLSKVNPSDDPDFYNDRGYQRYRENKLNDAITDFEKAISLSPKSIFYNNLGNAYSAQENFDKAVEAYSKAINMDYKNASAYNGLGYALKLKEKYDFNPETLEEAIKNFRQALNLNPKFVIAKNNLQETQRSLALVRNPNLLVKNDKECLKLQQKEPLFDTYRSVVQIVADIRGTSIGAGWVVKREGNKAWIVTNRHVVNDIDTDIENSNSGTQKIKVRFFCKGIGEKIPPEYNAQIISPIKVNESLDLAILEVTDIPDDIKELTKFSGIIDRNTSVSIIGHPNGNDWKQVTGKISHYLEDENKIQIIATIDGGNSGGPVLDEQNRVVGVIVEKFEKLPADNNDSSKSISNQESGFAYSIEIVIKQLRSWGMI